MNKSNALKKQDLVIGELKTLWQPSDSRLEHFDKFISICKKQIGAVFPSVSWDEHIWEISNYESTQSARQATHASNVLFTRKNGAGKKVKVAAQDQVPFPQPFLDLAKAIVVLRHLSKPVTHGAHMVAIRAFRYLFEVFERHGLQHIHQLNGIHFNEACQEALRHGETDTTLYRTGEHLSYIAEKLNLLSLSPVFEWHNPFPRVTGTGGSIQMPISRASDLEQAKQLPKTAFLVHLAALWRHYEELEQGDKMTVCMGVLLMATGLRMDEFCGLHLGCIPDRAEFESQPLELIFSGRMGKVLRLSVLARKRFAWDEKIIPASLADTVFLVIERMTVLSSEARRYCQKLLNEKRWPALDEFSDNAIVSAKELATYFGYDHTSNFISALERCGISRQATSLAELTAFKISDIHHGIANTYRKQIKTLTEGLGTAQYKIPFWQILTLQFKFEHGRGGLKMFPVPLSGTQIQDAFCGRDYIGRISKRESRICSLFERYKFDGLELPPGGVRTHQFRHLLNTIMQQSAAFSQEDIAKHFLRAGVRDNIFYDHSTPHHGIVPALSAVQQFGAKFESGYESKQRDVNAEDAKKFIRKFPLLNADELLSELDSLGSSHLMDIGRCRHDYTQAPCGKHYACLNNCQHYRRVKGNSMEVERIQQMKARAELQISAAKLDVEDGLVNAHVWLAHHQRLLTGCNSALAIEEDDQYQVGEIVAIFPNGRDSCEVR
jgi:hypothetical protein